MIPRIYLPRKLDVGFRLNLDNDHQRYIKNVLRLQPGNSLTLFDGSGWEYHAVISGFPDRGVDVVIDEKKIIPADHNLPVTLGQALPKGEKMEFIIQKSTELGVDRIIPFKSSRTVVRLSNDGSNRKLARWRKIAAEAARQCGRGNVPQIGEVVSFREFLSIPAKEALKIIFWESEEDRLLKDILRNRKYRNAASLHIVVGPEGGFSPQEIQEASEAGFLSASLGSRVLRTETVSLAVLSIIQYEFGQPSSKKSRSRVE